MSEENPNFHNSSSSLDNLRVISYCPLCNSHYNPSQAKVLEEKDGAHLIHVECKKCDSSIVAVIITGGIGVSSVGLITDLTSDDVIKFKNQDPVTDDDVIEAYEIVKNNNFIKMLNE